MRVIETTLDDDLAVISSYFWSQDIRHRVFEERGRQVLEVPDDAQAERARQLYAAWRDGRLRLVPVAPPPRAASRSGGAVLWRGIRHFPALSVLVSLAILVFPFSLEFGEGHPNAVAAVLLIVDPATFGPGWPGVAGAGAAAAGSPGLELWRWVTPILLHFSIAHLAFNCVVVIDLGRRIEAACRSVGFAVVVLGTAIASNLAQLLFGGSALFGGLSGVGYGLLGFLLVMARRFPGDRRWRLPPGIALGLLVFLVVFTTGITEPFGFFVANAAHWGGLAAGGILALLWPAGKSRANRGAGIGG